MESPFRFCITCQVRLQLNNTRDYCYKCFRKTPEYKHYQAVKHHEWYLKNVDYVKAKVRVYEKTENGRRIRRKAQAKYRASKNGKEARRKYWTTERAKEVVKKYRASKKGQRTIDAYTRSIAGKYDASKSQAKIRGKPFLLSFEEYSELVGPNKCFYCSGELPAKGCGLDRLDNSKGYEKSNVVPCCAGCQKLRFDHITKEENLALVTLLKSLRKTEGSPWIK